MKLSCINFIHTNKQPASQGNSLELPIGTILPYVGNLADIPKGWYLCDGSNGTPNLLDGKFLEGNYSIKTIYHPGLPNITGSFGTAVEENGCFFSGAFFANGSGPGAGDGWDDLRVGFDASRSNAIYGNSETVQPYAYCVYYIIRIK